MLSAPGRADPGHDRLRHAAPDLKREPRGQGPLANRPLVVFDVLSRLLRTLYPTVTYVRNITDIDDKINARAKERGIDIRELTETTVARFREDCEALN